MKPAAFREMTKDELLHKLNELQEAQFNLKFQHATGQLDNTAQVPKNKNDIARIMTILSEMDKTAGA
ncbi:MAG: 50S ribosomal protein L29 [Syntrophobacteraceae bacterium]